MIHSLSEFSYTERMLYLILNTDETFECRWVDYHTISGFEEVMGIEEGLEPPIGKESTQPPKDPEVASPSKKGYNSNTGMASPCKVKDEKIEFN